MLCEHSPIRIQEAVLRYLLNRSEQSLLFTRLSCLRCRIRNHRSEDPIDLARGLNNNWRHQRHLQRKIHPPRSHNNAPPSYSPRVATCPPAPTRGTAATRRSSARAATCPPQPLRLLGARGGRELDVCRGRDDERRVDVP